MTINAVQCRAARAILGWTQKKLAQQSGVSLATVWRLEDYTKVRRISQLARQAILESIKDAGVTLLPGGAAKEESHEQN